MSSHCQYKLLLFHSSSDLPIFMNGRYYLNKNSCSQGPLSIYVIFSDVQIFFFGERSFIYFVFSDVHANVERKINEIKRKDEELFRNLFVLCRIYSFFFFFFRIMVKKMVKLSSCFFLSS